MQIAVWFISSVILQIDFVALVSFIQSIQTESRVEREWGACSKRAASQESIRQPAVGLQPQYMDRLL